MTASTLGYTPGSGANVATDQDGGGAHHQKALIEHLQGGEPTPASQANPMPMALYGEAIEALEALRMGVQALTRTMGQMQPDTAARMRVAIDAISGGLTLATITTVGSVTTLATLTNQTQIGGLAATEQIPSLMRLGADSLRRNISVT
jgi:hypothetical protein